MHIAFGTILWGDEWKTLEEVSGYCGDEIVWKIQSLPISSTRTPVTYDRSAHNLKWKKYEAAQCVFIDKISEMF